MKTLFILILNGAFWCSMVQAQEKTFTVSLSTDSVLIGNVVQVEFRLQNVDGEFVAPVFEKMDIIAGPNVSSSYSMINGATNQSKTYTYILKPSMEGSFYIPPAYLQDKDQSLETEAIKIDVYPNPNNIINEWPQESMMQSFQFNMDEFPFDFDLNDIFPNDMIPQENLRNKQDEQKVGKRKLQKI